MTTSTINPARIPWSRREVIELTLLLIVGLLFRLLWAWPALSGERGFWMGDDDDYHRLALSLLQGGPLGYDGQPSAYRMPLFPMFLAGIYALVGPIPERAVAVMVILGISHIGLAYYIGRQLSGRLAAVAAALFSAFNTDLSIFAGTLMTETLCTILLICGVLSVIRLQRHGDRGWAVVAGVLLGLTCLTRINMLVLIPILCAWLLWKGNANLRERLITCAIILGLCGSIWGAWVIRNQLAFGTLIPLTTQSGNGYYGVFNDEAAKPQPIATYGSWRNLDLPPEVLAAQGEVERDHIMRKLAFVWIQQHPTESVLLSLAQIYQLWSSTYPNPFHTPLLVLACIGLAILVWRGDSTGQLWLMLLVTMSAFAVISLAVARFNVPVIPVLCALAGITIVRITQALQRVLKFSTQEAESNLA